MGLANPIKYFPLSSMPMGINLQFAPQLGNQVFALAVPQKVSQIGECTDFHAAL